MKEEQKEAHKVMKEEEKGLLKAMKDETAAKIEALTEKESPIKTESLIKIRDACPEDAEALLKIYAPYITDTAISFEYELPGLSEFRERIAHILEKYPYILAVKDEEILGYAYASAFHPRAAYQWSVELSIYVDSEKKHSGVGGRLYRELEQRLKSMGFLNINSCIAVPREGTSGDEYLDNNSMHFHEHLGFRLVGRFHDSGYKFGRWYDMIWMEKLIGEHGSAPHSPWDKA